jgi:hypothetical protein
VDAANKRVRLSRKNVLEKAAQDEFNEYRESVINSAESSGGLGSLGDLLKARLEDKKS